MLTNEKKQAYLKNYIFWNDSPRPLLHLLISLLLLLICYTTYPPPEETMRSHNPNTEEVGIAECLCLPLQIYIVILYKIWTIWVGLWTEDGLVHVLLIAMFWFHKIKQYEHIPLMQCWCLWNETCKLVQAVNVCLLLLSRTYNILLQPYCQTRVSLFAHNVFLMSNTNILKLPGIVR